MMSTETVFYFLLVISLVGVGLFFLRPKRLSPRTIDSVLDFLWAYGKDRAKQTVTHRHSGRQVCFELRMVGGVKQLYCSIHAPELSRPESEKLQNWLVEGAKVQVNRSSRNSKTLVLGYSLQETTALSRRIMVDFLGWGERDRLDVSGDLTKFSIIIPSYLRAEVKRRARLKK
jgi:hypothetical protein